MNQTSIQAWTNRYVYENLLESNLRSMALALRISEKTLEKTLRSADSAESAMVFQHCIRYMVARNIDITKVFRKYFDEDK